MLRGKRSVYLVAMFVLAVISFMGFNPAMAVTFQVNSTEDATDNNHGDGVCETAPGNGVCTLRAAIQEHNGLGGTNTINLPADTYTLTIAGTGENAGATGDLNILTGTLTINGSGANTTIIQAATTATDGIDRVFEINAATVNISGVTIRYGRVSTGSSDGGGIKNEGTLNLTNVTVSNNSSGGTAYGGGIYSEGILNLDNCIVTENKRGWGGGMFLSGTTSIINSLISANSTTAGNGGGILGFWGTLTISRSTISGNNTIPGGYTGGGIFSNQNFILKESTVASNEASSGGGICSQGNATITNSTISGNISTWEPGEGAGVLNTACDICLVSIINSTISNNTGIGVTNWRNATPSFTLKNVIVANNTTANCSRIITSGGHNLDSGNTCGFSGSGDLQNIDPLLGPLQDNGGPTFTHALLPGSPAIDAADPTNFPPTDQRDVTRPQGSGPDIGAYELQPIKPDRGTIGTEMTIMGSQFGLKKGKALIGSAALKVLEWTDGSIRCQLTRVLSPGTYDVTIQAKAKGASPIIFKDGFTGKAPEIDSVDPTSGSAGDEITIYGSFFGTKKGKVTLATKSCKVLNWTMDPTTGESEIDFVVPKRLDPGTYELKVTTTKVGSDTVNFTVE